MLAVLSPAKTLDCDIEFDPKKCSQPALQKEAKLLCAELKKLSESAIAKLMTVSAKIAELNHERFQELKVPLPVKKSAPALFAYKGDVYKTIEVEDYSAAELKFADKQIRILSGLYGVLKPMDLIQPYRLEMKTKLATKGHKDLYSLWGSKISEELNSSLKKKGDYLINLASNEYFKAIDQKALNAEVINVDFKEKKGANYKIVALFAKQARGAMANYIVRERATKPEDLKEFRWDGYRFKSSLSAENHFVFTRG